MYNARCCVGSRQYPMSYLPHYPVHYYVHQQQNLVDPVDTLKTIMLMYGTNDVTSLLDILPKEVLYQIVAPYLRERYLKNLGARLREVPDQALGTYEYSVADYIRDHGQPRRNPSGWIDLYAKGLTSLIGLDQITNPESMDWINLGGNFLSDTYIGDEFSSYVIPYTNIPPAPFQRFVNLRRVDLQKNWFRAIPRYFSGAESLRTLFLNDNRIETIERGALGGLKHLESLNLYDNKIERIERGAFEGLNHLSELHLYNNRIKTIESGALDGLNGLKSLYLNKNKIKRIEPGAFSGLNSLVLISLSFNRINRIEQGAFRGLNNLMRLYLSSNQIERIERGALDGLNHLQSLYLNENQINRIEPGAFHSLNLLLRLDLKINQLETIEQGAFEGLDSLEDLYLNDNKIKIVEPGAFHGLNRLEELSIEDNHIPGTKEEFIAMHPPLQRAGVYFDPQTVVSFEQ